MEFISSQALPDVHQSACTISASDEAHTHPLPTTATITLTVRATQLPQQLPLKNHNKSRTSFLNCGNQKLLETAHWPLQNAELAFVKVPKNHPESLPLPKTAEKRLIGPCKHTELAFMKAPKNHPESLPLPHEGFPHLISNMKSRL